MLRNYKLKVVYLLLVIALIASFDFQNTETNASGAELSPGARWGETISVFSAARGNPWINLTDGKLLDYDFAGQSKNLFNLEDESFDSISGATADFDNDGMPDLVIGHKVGKEGYFSFVRGNVDSVFPNTPEAKERLAKGVFTSAPFIGPARVIKLDGLVPDYFAAGDFDADGNFDLAVAEQGQSSIAFFLGNGKGGFAKTRSIELSGVITAFLSQDFNRNDGTDDLIVGIRTMRGSQLLVFESPYGVLKSELELFDLSGEITSLAIGSIEGDARYDLAIAAGNELVILHGRDRKLMFDASGASAEPVKLTRRTFDLRVKAVTVGDFIKSSKHTSEIALLTDDGRLHLFEKEEDNSFGSSRIIDLGAAIGSESSTSERKPIMLTARVSARPVDTLIIGSNSRIHLLTSDFIGPQNGSETADLASQAFGLQASLDAKQDLNAILPMRLNVDALSDLVILEDGSATPAIIQTEPMATYVVNSPLIDPDANPGDGFCLTFNGGCTLRAAIEEANNQPGSHTINFDIDVEGVPTTSGPGIGIFSPVVIDGTTQLAGLVEISGNAGVPANLFTGSQTDNCVFRGLVMNGIGPNYYMNPQGRNNIIEGNLIGTDAANENVIGNGGVGLSISSDLGGATQGASITFNTIAGNGSHGLLVSNGSNLNIQGNYVGASPKNSESFGNKGDGIRLENAPMDNNVSFNRIRSNGGTGINLATTSQFDLNNVFSYNEISDNGGLGIDLGGDGVTGNDLCDIDTGTNALQNFPIISTATRIGNNIRVVGSFNSVPNANYNLSFYANQTADPTGYGEGQTWLGDLSINVPASCQTNFTVMVPNNMQSGRCVSATAIDDDGNTSEFSNCVRIRNTPNSFDGDGLTDVAIYRPSVGQWWFLRSSDGSVFAAEFGTSTDRITPGDWTGDGVADMALWRPSTGEWFVVRSEDFSFFAFPFGSNGDIPTPADYDGDGIFDPTVFRPSAALWFVLRSSDGNVEISQFGSSGDKPVVADYDGDGRDDIAIFRPGPGEWWYRRSSDNTVTALQFGLSTDLPVQGDYTGDGKADIALWRPSIGFWYVLRSEDNSFFGFPWGSNGDIPAPADYDGDGRFDPAVFRPATTTWFIDRTTAGTSIFNFGSTGDKPVPSAYIPMP